MNKSQKTLLAAAALAAVLLIVVLFLGYQADRRELSALKNDLNASTEAWKQTNEKKLAVQKELNAAKSELREAELTLSESEESTGIFQSDIAALEKEIQELKSMYMQEDFKLMGAYEIDYLLIALTVTMLCEQYHLTV